MAGGAERFAAAAGSIIRQLKKYAILRLFRVPARFNKFLMRYSAQTLLGRLKLLKEIGRAHV